MDYVRGIDLEVAWHVLPREQKDTIIKELGGYIEQLRSLKPPQEGLVGSALLKEGLDHRIGSWPWGPFKNHDDFHSFIRRGAPLENCTKIFGQEVTACHSRRYESRFAHADLCTRNIVVKDGHIAALIDWQFGGWYPEYWEYTKAHFGMNNVEDWYTRLKDVMERYDNELLAERTLWRRCDQPGDVQIIYQGLSE